MSKLKLDKLKHLYVKTHNVTKLKYFGKTEKNPFKYKGSGNKWLIHLDEYGNDVSTEIIFSSFDPLEIRKKGIELSILWNIIESEEWANEKIEIGDGGFTPKWSDETREKIIFALKGKSRSKTKSTFEKKRKERLEKETVHGRKCCYCGELDSLSNMYVGGGQSWHRRCANEFKKRIKDLEAFKECGNRDYRQCKYCGKWSPSEEIHKGLHKTCRSMRLQEAANGADFRLNIVQGLRKCYVCHKWDDPASMYVKSGQIWHRECMSKKNKESRKLKKIMLGSEKEAEAKRLYAAGDVSIKELASRFGITAFRMTKILDGIQGKWGKKNPLVRSKEEKLEKRRQKETIVAREKYRSSRTAMGFTVKVWSKYKDDNIG